MLRFRSCFCRCNRLARFREIVVGAGIQGGDFVRCGSLTERINIGMGVWNRVANALDHRTSSPVLAS